MQKLIFAATLAALSHHAAATEVTCSPTTKNSMQCVFKNTGTVEALTCLEVVRVCRDGEHVGNVCGGWLAPGAVDSKVVTGFTPKVRFLTTCMGTEYRNVQTTPRPFRPSRPADYQ